MITRKLFSLILLLLFNIPARCDTALVEQFKQVGYVEICNPNHGAEVFDGLYLRFDELLDFLQANPVWSQKLYGAKERFIRSKDRNYYSTNFFGLYDESKKNSTGQIAFYYSSHFHKFIKTHYSELHQVPQIGSFLEACFAIQEPYGQLSAEIAAKLDLTAIFASNYHAAPILFKVVKYLPTYHATRPHYDGTAFSLLLDSTDHQALRLAPYQSSFTPADFTCPTRKFSRSTTQNSLLLIPGALLTEFAIYPTPHIIRPGGNVRYATIAFAMRPNYPSQANPLSPLPNF